MLLKTFSFNIGEDVKCYNHHELLPSNYLMKRISTITKGDVTQNVSYNIGEDVKCYNHHEILPYTCLMKRISTTTKYDVTQNVLFQYWRRCKML